MGLPPDDKWRAKERIADLFGRRGRRLGNTAESAEWQRQLERARRELALTRSAIADLSVREQWLMSGGWRAAPTKLLETVSAEIEGHLGARPTRHGDGEAPSLTEELDDALASAEAQDGELKLTDAAQLRRVA